MALKLGMFSFGSLASAFGFLDLWLGIFGLGPLAWDLRVEILGLRNWNPEAGGTAGPELGGHGRATDRYSSLRN